MIITKRISSIIDGAIDGPYGWYKCSVGILVSISKNTHLNNLFESFSPYWIDSMPLEYEVPNDIAVIRYPEECVVTYFELDGKDLVMIHQFMKDLGID